MEKATVYFTKDLSAKGLMKAYNALGVQLKGKVAVKISTGEPGGHNFLQPALIQDLVKALNGTIVECNTAYGDAAGGVLGGALEGHRGTRVQGHRAL